MAKTKKETQVKTLTAKGINDFMVCELFYECRHERNEHEIVLAHNLMADRFENTLKRVAAFFFYKKQSGNVPSYNALLNRWEKLWFDKDMTAYDMAIEQHSIKFNNIASFSNIAAASLEVFHDNFAEDSGIPIMIDEEFIVPFGNEIRLSGSFDLILKYGKEYRIIKWYGRRLKPKNGSTLLDFAALKYAFDYKANKKKRASYRMYNLSSAQSPFMKIQQPSRDDVYALQYWAKEVANTDTFVPRRGFTAYCRDCPFDEICLAWNDWPVKEELENV